MKILQVLSVSLLLLVLVVGTASAQTEALTGPGAQSVTYQINPAHTGAISVSGVEPPLEVKWTVDLGATVSYPLIAQGMVFVLTGDSNSNKVQLYALNAKTGAIVWGPVLIPQPLYFWAAAAYDNGVIFVVPDSNQGDTGQMLAFNASDGAQLWSTTLTGQYLFNSAPTALNGIVYTGGAGSGGTLYALQESDGVVLWTASVENGNNSSPAVNGSSVYVAYVCPQTYDFNSKTGALLWHYNPDCEGGGGATPVLFNGSSLYVRDSFLNSDNGVILNAKKGTVTSYFNSQFAPAFSGKNVFYTETAGLTAVDTATQITAWTATPPAGDSYSSPPIVVNGIVYIGTASGYLLGYEAANGASKVSMNLGTPISAFDSDSFGSPTSGLGAGQGILVVPASTKVIALAHQSK